MKTLIPPTVMLAISLLAVSCSGPATPALVTRTSQLAGPTSRPTGHPPTQMASQTAASPTESSLPPAFQGGSLPTTRGQLFVGSGVCAACHTQLSDEAGHNVSMDALWQTTMMANSARDPYWQASLRRETRLTPPLKPVIEDTCSRCHMPMARTTAAAAGNQGVVLDDGFLNPTNPLHDLAMDGVSCSICHQIEADQLGQAATFDGQFIINTQSPMGERPAYGPFAVDQDNSQVMKMASGLVPTQGEQMGQSELCATCHTLYTPFVDANGKPAGEFPEQMPYLEWEASSYNGEQTCQACHMPEASGGVVLSITGGPSRQPVRMHSFLGGSNTVLEELRADGDDLGVTASSDQLEDEIARMTQQMQAQAASVSIEDAGLDGGSLTARVIVKDQTGHKFPTAFPSRRVWLHITVIDSTGQTVFESGAYEPNGRIIGNANDDDASSFEPHYTTLSSPDQVQIYEDIMADTDGDVTTTLMRAATYVKDNRLLPEGFDKASVAPDIAIVGAAQSDPDFTGGGDTVHLSIDPANAVGPFTLQVEVNYQSVGYRWAENINSVEAPEIERFASLYSQVGNRPVTVASARAQVKMETKQ